MINRVYMYCLFKRIIYVRLVVRHSCHTLVATSTHRTPCPFQCLELPHATLVVLLPPLLDGVGGLGD